MGLNLAAVGLPPYAITALYPFASEIMVHPSMMPNPDGGDPEDDDVDSLDVVPGEDFCPFWYFSADHEAFWGLDPGDIYEVTAMGPVMVVDDVFNLGISDDADVDAFEFTWAEMPDVPGTLYLAVMFSVDEDDPLTVGDESGGMDPTMIYISWLTGFYMPMSDPLGEDVDALTCWDTDLQPATIVSVRSCRYHAGVGPYCLNIGLGDGGGTHGDNVEPRVGGADMLEFTVTAPVTNVSASVSCASSVYVGSAVTSVVGNVVTVNFTPALPDQDCCRVNLTGDVYDGRYVAILGGDANRDADVNSLDYSAVKLRLGQPVNDSNCQVDVDANNDITSLDYSAIKLRLGHVVASCP